jgi:ATP-dependent Clp protease ATP-binding subunit ClpA
VSDPYERFTDHALLAIVLAEEEARRLNHNHIGAEHLLLGLVREGNGVAARMLAGLGVELADVRSAVESVIGAGEGAVGAEIELTPHATRTLQFAHDAAQRLHHGAVGTEHLLLGLARTEEGIAAAVLESLGVNIQRVSLQLSRLLTEQGAPARTHLEPADQPAGLAAQRRSLDAIQRLKDTAISLGEYERLAHLQQQEAALLAAQGSLDHGDVMTSTPHLLQSELGTGEHSPRSHRDLGRTFRNAFDLGLALAPSTRNLLEAARTFAEIAGQSTIRPEHILLALTMPDSGLAGALEQRGVDVQRLQSAAEALHEDLARGERWPFPV